MTLQEFIAEVETDFHIYADSGDIDTVKIKMLVLNELKRFGNNILEDCETVVRIKNSSAKLPDNSRKLKAAIKCEPFYYEVKGNKDHLQSSYFWKERIEQNLVWNEETEKYEDGCNSKVITEKLFYHDNHVNFH